MAEEKVFNLDETSAPVLFVSMIADNWGAKAQTNHMNYTLRVSQEVIHNLLRDYKNKEVPVVVAVKDVNNDVLYNARVSWTADEAAENGGDWSYQASFEDLSQEGDNVINMNDSTVVALTVNMWCEKYNSTPKSQHAVTLNIAAYKVLKQYMQDNCPTDPAERYSLTVPDVFTARSGLENDVVVTTIATDGELKARIKDDADKTIPLAS